MRIDSFAAAANTTYSGTDILSKIKPGDNVRAQILENSGSDLTLKFSDGTIVTAAAAKPVEAAKGEFVNLTFQGFVDERPAFEVTEKALPPQPDKALLNIGNVLSSLKLPLTDQNIQIAQALMDQNLPVITENMSKMSELLKVNLELKPDAAAFLTASKLSEDTNNIDKLQSLLAGRLKISNDISELVKLIGSQSKSGTDISAGTAETNTLVTKILVLLSEKGTLNIKAAVSGNIPAENSSETVQNSVGTAANNEVTAGQTNETAVKSEALNANAGNQAKMPVDTAAAGKSDTAVSNAQTAINLPDDNGGEPTSTTKTNIQDTETSVKTTALNKKTAEKPGITGNSAENKSENTVSTKDSNNADSTNSAKSINNTNNTELKAVADRLTNILKGEATPGKSDLPLIKEFDKELSGLMNSGKLSGEEMAAAKQLAGEERVFTTAVKALKSLFVRIDETSEKINPVKLYKEMDSVLQTLKSTLQQLPQGMREAAATIVNNLESNVNFINQLNNYSSYVQLPLSIFNQNTTGELYMLKKGSKHKKLDPSNMTVLISLDSNNIGRIDTLLSVDKRNISTNFRLENSEVFPVLKEHHKQLYNSLLEKGFRLVDFTYRLMDEPINIINFEAEAKKEFIKSSNNIDISI